MVDTPRMILSLQRLLIHRHECSEGALSNDFESVQWEIRITACNFS